MYDAEPILIVDKEEEPRNLLAFLFREAGHPVSVATSGADAIQRLMTARRTGARERIRALVISHPTLIAAGPRFLESLRADFPKVNVIVIFPTGEATAYARRKLLRSRAYYIEKPFSVEELLGMTGVLLEQERVLAQEGQTAVPALERLSTGRVA